MIDQEKAEAVKNQLVAASFTAWQIANNIPFKKQLSQHLSTLGLAEKAKPMSKEYKEIVVKRAYDKAQSVLERMKKAGL
jgi:hypothetical protein